MIIWLSGFERSARLFTEAADLDSTNGWQRFRFVTAGLHSTACSAFWMRSRSLRSGCSFRWMS